ncbi:MAG: inositol monophosphatase [Opitutaceae bacterium]|jgi:myo-inositol-1(or 4)-monophosphatase
MPATEQTSRIAFAQQAVMAQTELMHRDFGRVQSQWKADGTRVTSSDLAISEAIAQGVAGRFSDDQFFSEELANAGAPMPVTSRFSWVLDPIDGTNNYAMGLPHCAISLALLENGRPFYGVIYDMARRTLIHGGPGFGVMDGDRRAHVLTEPACNQSIIGFHSPYARFHSEEAKRIIENYKIRGLGSSTLHLAYVAAGIINGVVDHNVKLWDIAAAVPLVEAAGGEVRYLKWDPFPMKIFDQKMERITYVAGCKAMCDHLCETLTG